MWNEHRCEIWWNRGWKCPISGREPGDEDAPDDDLPGRPWDAVVAKRQQKPGRESRFQDFDDVAELPPFEAIPILRPPVEVPVPGWILMMLSFFHCIYS